jgi:hypothetical protein
VSKARENRLPALALAAAVLAAGLIGTVNASQQVTQDDAQTVTTGHTEFLEASTSFNSCFAGLAGKVVQRVTWFGGQELFTRVDGGDDQWIYVTEHLEDDGEATLDPTNDAKYNESTGIAVRNPTQERLYKTDREFTFEDPNDQEDANDPIQKTWTVREYFAIREQNTEAGETGVTKGQESADTEKVYVFAVKTDDPIIDPDRGKYTFAMVIDTCRFHEAAHQGDANHNEQESWANEGNQHQESDTDHEHDQFGVDIWIGGQPDPVNDVEGTEVPDERDGSDPGDGQSSGDDKS